ncbi:MULTISPECIES: hypothetical protein [unclassified Brevundimonas]|uniref:hypothetical protein n=1 Tax=unclassified Brevundimonas TaxID=2622653 RepID=UPI0025C180B9|nr:MULTISPECIES: hypothetical protein [unclassified Brevundimonas]
MALHPIFQGIADGFMPPVAANDGPRPIAEGVGSVVAQLERVVARKHGKTVVQNIADMGGWSAPEHDSERYRMLDKAFALRGMPHRFGGTADGSAFDAWSYARACATHATQRDCIDVQRQGVGWGIEEQEARKALSQWGLTEIKLRHAQPGDLLLFAMPEERLHRGPGLPPDVKTAGMHVGIMSAPGGDLTWAMLPNGKPKPEAKMLHVCGARPITECWVGPMWSDNLVAAFSFGDPTDERPVLKAVA